MKGKLNIKKINIDYKWIIAAILFLVVFTGLGFCSSAKPTYTKAITDALGLSRSAYSINDSCRYITTTVLNLFFGVLVYRYGTKKLIVAGMVALIISSLCYSFATSLLLIYLGGIFLGIGVAWTTTSMVGAVVNKWFDKNRGTIIGIILASNGLGAALCIQITTPMVYQSNNPFGYRHAYILISLILVAVTILALIFYKDKSFSTDNHDNKKRDNAWHGFKYEDIVKKPYFYVLLITIASMMLTGIGSIVQPHFYDVGLDADFIAYISSMSVIILAASKLLVGYLYDHFGLRLSLNLCLAIRIISAFLVIFVANSEMGRCIAVIYNILYAVATPLETVLLPIIVLDIFGDYSYNKVLGIITAVSTAGQTLGAPLLNLSYDLTNSYRISFLLAGILDIVVLTCFNHVINASKKDKLKLESA